MTKPMTSQPEWMYLLHDTRPGHEGKAVLARPHEATFKGKHNASKSMALITLCDCLHKEANTAGLSLKELAEQSGVDYYYLKGRLHKWVEWKYLSRKIGESERGPVYMYTIAKRGERFVEHRIPRDRLQDYVAAIREHRAKYSS